jgi:hypothetical protein
VKYIKTYENYIEEKIQKEINESAIQDPDLEDFRYFRGSILQFKQYWERKMSKPFNPHGTVHYKYPKERKEEDKSLPYQDFVNGTSSMVQYNLNNRKKSLNKEGDN